MTVLVHILLAACSLRIFTILLLRQGSLRPLTLALWLVAMALAVLGSALLARRSPEARFGLYPALRKLDVTGVVFLVFFLVLVSLFHQCYERAASDGRDYFVQARSLVIDHDWNVENEIAHFRARGSARIYPVGAAVLWSPFYTAAHVWLGVLNLFGGDHGRDGYSNSYQMAAGFGTLVYGFVGLVLIYRVLRHYFSRTLSLVTVLALSTGTFVIWYLVVESSMTHGASLFGTTLFLWYWHETRGSRTTNQWMLLGGAAAIMTMVRWQNALFVLVVLADVVPAYVRSIKDADWAGVGSLLRSHALGALAGIVVFSPQLMFWRANSGSLLGAPTDRYGMAWLNPQLSNVLFSPNHGLLTWTPLVYLSLLGLIPFLRRAPTVAWWLIGTFLAQVWVNGAVTVWWGGSGFGARRFANSTLVFAVGLAAFLHWWRRHPSVGIAVLVAPLLVANLFLMRDVRAGLLPSGRGITFPQMLNTVYTRLGNPWSFPGNALYAWRYGGTMVQYDELGQRIYRNAVIDLGEEDDAPFVLSGWSDRERDREQSFRWGVTTESRLVVPIRSRSPHRLEFRARPFTIAGAPPSEMTISVNGAIVKRVELEPGWAEYQVHIPAANVDRTLTEIRFAYRYATSPLELGISEDGRPLTARFDYVRVLRADRD